MKEFLTHIYKNKRFIFSAMFTGLICFSVINTKSQINPSAKAKVSTRAITVVSEPDATVWIDDVRYGKTDKSGKLEIKTVLTGKHSLRVRAVGFKQVTKILLPAQKGETKVPLVKLTDEGEITFQEAEKLATVDREKAIETYRKAIKLRPKMTESYIGLARMLIEGEKYDEAEETIIAVRKVRPSYAEASAVEGRIFRESGEEERAIASFKRAIKEGNGFQPEAFTGLGLLYKDKAQGFGAAGDFEQEEANYIEAINYLNSAIKQLSGAPDAEVIYQLLGLVYERMKKYDDAIAVYEEFLQLFPSSRETTAVRSFITQLRKQMEP